MELDGDSPFSELAMHQDSHAQHPLIANSKWHIAASTIFLIGIIAAGRAVWLSLYGADIPFWDQWVQVISQLAPLKDGTWHYADYWAPHNEHRVLFTRLTSMMLFQLNGGAWSNLIEAYANTVIYGAVMGLFYALACREANRAFCAVMLIAVIMLGIVPYDWENTLVGFQNQFYFMLAFAILLTGVASYRLPDQLTAGVLLVLAVASLFTMASGLFGAAAVCVVIALKAWRERLPARQTTVIVLSMVVVVALGMFLLPPAPGNDGYRAQGIADHIRAIATALMWPLNPGKPKYFLLAIVVWAPSALCLLKLLRTRAARDSEIFLMGLAAWVIFQAVAIAHARGHQITSISSRYTNITALGLLANLGIERRLTSDTKLGAVTKYAGRGAIAIGVGIISYVFVLRTPADIDSMQQRYDFSRMETFYTRSYLLSKDPTYLQHSSLAIPFPDAGLLKNYLDSPVVESLLPPTLQQTRINSNDYTNLLAQSALKLQASVQQFMAKAGVNSPSIFFKELTITPNGEAEASPIGSCSVTNVNETEISTGPLVAKSGDPLRFYGWLINPRSRETRKFSITLRGKETYTLDVDPFLKRKDVQRAMHSKAQDTFGFRAYGVLRDVAPGNYTLQLTTQTVPRQLICNLPYQLAVSPQK